MATYTVNVRNDEGIVLVEAHPNTAADLRTMVNNLMDDLVDDVNQDMKSITFFRRG